MLGKSGQRDAPATGRVAVSPLGSYVPEEAAESNGARTASINIAVATAGGIRAIRQPAGKENICNASDFRSLPLQVQAAVPYQQYTWQFPLLKSDREDIDSCASATSTSSDREYSDYASRTGDNMKMDNMQASNMTVPLPRSIILMQNARSMQNGCSYLREDSDSHTLPIGDKSNRPS